MFHFNQSFLVFGYLPMFLLSLDDPHYRLGSR